MALSIVQSSDGRRQRSERSQTAIIKAALSLMDEGTLVPTAQQIADRAGVGIRSFFRHFADMDSLFLAADEMLLSSYEALFEVDDRAGTLSERVARAIDLYGNAFDQLREDRMPGRRRDQTVVHLRMRGEGARSSASRRRGPRWRRVARGARRRRARGRGGRGRSPIVLRSIRPSPATAAAWPGSRRPRRRPCRGPRGPSRCGAS